MKVLKYLIAQKPISDDLVEDVAIDFRPITRPCSDENFEWYLEISKAQAYNGEVTVEDIPDEPVAPTQLDRVEAQTTYTAMMTNTLLEV